MTPLFDQVPDQIRQRGGRMTTQRQLILNVLEDGGGHPTAEEIFSQVREKDETINLSTVYRTLRWLEQQGVVNPRLFGEDRGQQRFDPVHSNDHHHFRCIVCDEIIEFSNPLVDTIKTTYEQQTGARIDSASLLLSGVCNTCLKKQSSR